VEHDVRAGDTADRTILVVDRRASPGIATPEIGGPAAHDWWEGHALRVDELRALDGVLGAHPEAGVHQIRKRRCIAEIVGYEVDARGVRIGVVPVVVFVATYRGICGFTRQAAAIGDCFGPGRVTVIVGFTDEDRIHDL